MEDLEDFLYLKFMVYLMNLYLKLSSPHPPVPPNII